jgi:hypothetical protein
VISYASQSNLAEILKSQTTPISGQSRKRVHLAS